MVVKRDYTGWPQRPGSRGDTDGPQRDMLIVGLGLQALLGLPDAVGTGLTSVAHAAFWAALAYAVMWLRLRRAIRRAEALPTI